MDPPSSVCQSRRTHVICLMAVVFSLNVYYKRSVLLWDQWHHGVRLTGRLFFGQNTVWLCDWFGLRLASRIVHRMTRQHCNLVHPSIFARTRKLQKRNDDEMPIFETCQKKNTRNKQNRNNTKIKYSMRVNIQKKHTSKRFRPEFVMMYSLCVSYLVVIDLSVVFVKLALLAGLSICLWCFLCVFESLVVVAVFVFCAPRTFRLADFFFSSAVLQAMVSTVVFISCNKFLSARKD